jgi:hypothetical protein
MKILPAIAYRLANKFLIFKGIWQYKLSLSYLKEHLK